MDYSIVPIDIKRSDHSAAVYRLLSETFGYDVPVGRLEDVTITNSEHDGLYLAAICDDEIVGFNAFISHDLPYGDISLNAYQSCWTATSSAHRGKKIFQNVINAAKEILAERGAAFIFGFPNDNSQPIFTKKLGFREIRSLKWQVPNLGFVRNMSLNKRPALPAKGILQNDRQLIELKMKRPDGPPVVVEHDLDVIWGVTRLKEKAGMRIKYLDIGGVLLDNPENLGRSLSELARTVSGVRYFQLTTTNGSEFNGLFRRLRPAQTNDLIVYDLNFDTGDVPFDFFGGVRDVF